MAALRFALASLCISLIASPLSAQQSVNHAEQRKCPADVVSLTTKQSITGETEYTYNFRFDDGRTIGITYSRDPRPSFEWSNNRIMLLCPPNAPPMAATSLPSLASHATESGFALRLGSFRNADDANKLRNLILSNGFPALIKQVHDAKGTLYRVGIWPISSGAEAQKLKSQVAARTNISGLVRPYPEDVDDPAKINPSTAAQFYKCGEGDRVIYRDQPCKKPDAGSNLAPPADPKPTNTSPSWKDVFAKSVEDLNDAILKRNASRSGGGGTRIPTPLSAPTSSQSSIRAPLAPASCATYRASRYEPLMDSTYVEWRNVCNFPIEVHWCWVRSGQAKCKTNNAGNTLSPGETQTVVGPGGNVQPVAAYYVCDMSNASKLCSGWD